MDEKEDDANMQVGNTDDFWARLEMDEYLREAGLFDEFIEVESDSQKSREKTPPRNQESKRPTEARTSSPKKARAESPKKTRAKSPKKARAESPKKTRPKSPKKPRAKSPKKARPKSPKASHGELRGSAPSDAITAAPSIPSTFRPYKDQALNVFLFGLFQQFENFPTFFDKNGTILSVSAVRTRAMQENIRSIPVRLLLDEIIQKGHLLTEMEMTDFASSKSIIHRAVYPSVPYTGPVNALAPSMPPAVSSDALVPVPATIVSAIANPIHSESMESTVLSVVATEVKSEPVDATLLSIEESSALDFEPEPIKPISYDPRPTFSYPTTLKQIVSVRQVEVKYLMNINAFLMRLILRKKDRSQSTSALERLYAYWSASDSAPLFFTSKQTELILRLCEIELMQVIQVDLEVFLTRLFLVFLYRAQTLIHRDYVKQWATLVLASIDMPNFWAVYQAQIEKMVTEIKTRMLAMYAAREPILVPVDRYLRLMCTESVVFIIGNTRVNPRPKTIFVGKRIAFLKTTERLENVSSASTKERWEARFMWHFPFTDFADFARPILGGAENPRVQNWTRYLNAASRNGSFHIRSMQPLRFTEEDKQVLLFLPTQLLFFQLIEYMQIMPPYTRSLEILICEYLWHKQFHDEEDAERVLKNVQSALSATAGSEEERLN